MTPCSDPSNLSPLPRTPRSARAVCPAASIACDLAQPSDHDATRSLRLRAAFKPVARRAKDVPTAGASLISHNAYFMSARESLQQSRHMIVTSYPIRTPLASALRIGQQHQLSKMAHHGKTAMSACSPVSMSRGAILHRSKPRRAEKGAGGFAFLLLRGFLF